MKILKYVFLLLILASISGVVFIATQDGTYTVEKQKVINVSKPVLFSYITDYKNWQNLGLLAQADTTATYNFSKNTAGNGAYMQWQKNNYSGKITTDKIFVSDSVKQTVMYNGHESTITWTFTDTLNNSTHVKVRLTGTRNFKEKALSLLQSNVATDFEKTLGAGLTNLQAFLVTELRNYTTDIEGLVTKNGVFYIGHTQKGSVENITAKATDNFNKLLAFTAQNKMEQAGAPFIIYNNYNKAAKTASYTFAIPIKNEIYTAEGSEYAGGRLQPFTALKTTLKGDYSHLPEAWRKAGSYINGKALVENTTLNYVEVYVKTGAQTQRPSQWQTDIYIPVNNQELSIEALSVEGAAPATGSTPVTATQKPAAQKPATGTNTTKTAATVTKPTASGSVKPATGTAQKTTTETATGTKPKTGTTSGSTTNKPKGATIKPTGTTAKGTTQTQPKATTATTPKRTTDTAPKPKTAAAQKPLAPGDDGLNPPKDGE
ncbi:GyrI-like domain-containing protein [Flavobacterium sp. RHBU_24]|uniref:GyrI-like domain-containing protein n=1 Tax=Flavobacterium sp. RHBU_24 TaxID=3391185 RepID=UPI0039852713